MESNWWQTILSALACETKRFDLVSPRRREECVRLLRENTDRQWMIFGPRPVIGHVGDASFSLRKRIFCGNPLQTVVRGEFVEASRETRLDCVSAPNSFFVWFYLVFLGAAVLFMTMIIWSLITDASIPETESLIGLGIPLLIFAIGIALVRFCRFLARNEKRYLIEFLIDKLDAREVPVAATD